MRTSNAGQVLFTGIAKPERALQVADGLLRPEFFSGWGIRTVANTRGALQSDVLSQRLDLAARQCADRPRAWPATALKRSVERVFKGLFDAATYMELRRLPELFCGFQRGRGRGPTHYPVACSPQAWASATPFTLIEASLGLQFDPAANEIRLRNPRLPSFLDEVVLRNLQLKQSSVDLKVRRHANEVSVEILERRGQVAGLGRVRLIANLSQGDPVAEPLRTYGIIPLIPAHSASKTRVNALMAGSGPRWVPATGSPRRGRRGGPLAGTSGRGALRPRGGGLIAARDRMRACASAVGGRRIARRNVHRGCPMCRNIRTLHNFEPPATDEEIRASSLQFVRKLSGFTRPSKANQAAFNRAVEQVAQAAHELLDALVTAAPPRDREVEAAKARERAADRFRSSEARRDG